MDSLTDSCSVSPSDLCADLHGFQSQTHDDKNYKCDFIKQMPIERMVLADKIARIIGNSLWHVMSRDQIIDMVDFDEEEEDEILNTLWGALLCNLRTKAHAAFMTSNPFDFLLRDPKNTRNPEGSF